MQRIRCTGFQKNFMRQMNDFSSICFHFLFQVITDGVRTTMGGYIFICVCLSMGRGVPLVLSLVPSKVISQVQSRGVPPSSVFGPLVPLHPTCFWICRSSAKLNSLQYSSRLFYRERRFMHSLPFTWINWIRYQSAE